MKEIGEEKFLYPGGWKTFFSHSIYVPKAFFLVVLFDNQRTLFSFLLAVEHRSKSQKDLALFNIFDDLQQKGKGALNTSVYSVHNSAVRLFD